MKPVPCALCDSWNSRIADYTPQHTINLGPTTFVKDITNVICANCGLIYNSPRLEPPELASLYSAMARYMPIAAGPPSLAPSPSDVLEEEQFQCIVDHLDRTDLAGYKVMEIGCSLGQLLRRFHDAGATVYGLEPSEFDADYAENVNHVHVRREYFGPDSFPPESFDVIMLFYVFEHLDDPLAILHAIGSQLKRDGLLLLEVPDTDRPFVGLDPFFSLGHLFSYTSRTLKAFLQLAGLDVVRIQQLSNAGNTGKDFPRLRVIARNTGVFSQWDTAEEFDRMTDVIHRYHEARNRVIDQINGLLNTQLPTWQARADRVVIFGAGTHTSELLRVSDLRSTNLIGYVDSNPVFHGHSYLGLPVYSPQQIDELDANVIVISARGWETQIWERLASERARGIEVVPLYETSLLQSGNHARS